MLWAWERPEDLRFIETSTTGVAYLAQTLLLDGDEVKLVPRRQSMELADGTYLIAVTRIESVRSQDKKPGYSDEKKAEAAELILKTLERPGVRGVQIDFDAAVSERDFYRRLVDAVRAKIPEGKSLTMTALASWCVGETWLNTMDVDEAVPMAFEMGADTERVRSYIRSGQDWTVPLCRASYGLSVDEPGIEGIKPGRRVYWFSDKSWRPGMIR
ncbi:MAG: hypothetical protein QUS14_10360 [Pyrinomonadaceae bacterium]|nr:hypothetical protein [Pyrinomonadaceae bacterium]